MNEIDALLLGIIQGLTEFLPVSSSGHIELGKEILGSELINGQNLLFTIILHFATALSTIIVFREDIIKLITKSFSSDINDQKKFLFFIALSMIPAVVIGLFFEEELEELFSGNIFLVGFMLIITGFLLFSTTIFKNNTKRLTSKTSILIGISQAIAMLPGISRSGATISVSLLLGINKNEAAKFSFLMVIPLIFGKIIKDFFNEEIIYSNVDLNVFFVGFTSAFITGIIACKWMLKLVKNNKLKYFAYYCFIIGSIAITSYLI